MFKDDVLEIMVIIVWLVLGRPKDSFGFFHESLQKNLNKLFCQPNPMD